MAVCETLVASKYWRNLHGLLCLFKPSGLSTSILSFSLKHTISKGLNKMKVRQPRKIVQYDASYGIPMETIETDYSDHPLIIGPRYQITDIRLHLPDYLGLFSSGVYVLGLNGGTKAARDLESSKPLKVYHVSGQLGIATDNCWKTGKKIQRAPFSKIYRPHIDKALAAMQASHQRHMYTNAGVDVQSQEAYDLAVQGLLRPESEYFPIIYGMRCVHFERPFFTIEIACTNEQEAYLLNLIYTVGLKVKSVAMCTSIKCIRYGPFTLEHSLLQHSWNVEQLAANVELCNKINEDDLKSGRRDNVMLSPLSSTSNNGIDTSGFEVEIKKDTTHRERRRENRLRAEQLEKTPLNEE
ncbi:mitochondrial mRNA pseudouridine synthase Trub2 [Thrips palmi]|uniref:Mitochondrial mRNA pseudouridine synthase Trub2 n=1 Tax=Thrips palmi TaxID=161013 RepID=A0A6P8Z4S4_THRPL|nr:mitochondrial mRNA pseudouridine synthase Trub2 [Thrips palmi]